MAVLALAALVAGCSADPIPAPAPQAPPVPTVQAETTQLVAGVDEIGPGFNPHLRADQSPVTQAISTLVLPSVFRPDANGHLQLDRTIATSAQVTSTAPFTVSYELNVQASWSSGAPIAAEDFVYLWQQMRTQPGTIGSSGYRAISDVRSRAGGKAVDVTFDRPYPYWPELFSGLLPAHILKDAPGGWTAPMANGVPVSGGPYRVMGVDRVRGEVLLTRADPYWATPAVLDEIVLRRIDPSMLTAALGNRDVDLALPEAGPEVERAIAAVATGGGAGKPTVQRAPRPVVQSLEFRSGGGPLADPRVRQGVAAALDRDAIRRTVAPAALPADAFGPAPSEPGYRPSAPAGAPGHPDPAASAAALTGAGYVRGANNVWQIGGRPLSLVVGAGADRPRDVAVARVVVAQLRAAGIQATLVAPPAADLFAQPTVNPTTPTATPTPSAGGAGPAPGAPAPTTPQAPTTTTRAAPTTSGAPTVAPTGPGGQVAVDVLVGPRPAVGAEGPRLDSEYGCPDPAVPAGSPAVSCFPSVQPMLDRLTTAETAPADPAALAEAERVLWTQLPGVPLYQPLGLVVSTPQTDAATHVGPGPLATGPFTGATDWNEPEPKDR